MGSKFMLYLTVFSIEFGPSINHTLKILMELEKKSIHNSHKYEEYSRKY